MSLLDRVPFDECDPSAGELLDALGEAYPKTVPERLILRAGIRLQDIDLCGAMTDVWPRICRAAAAGQRLRALVTTIANDRSSRAFPIIQELARTAPEPGLESSARPLAELVADAADRERLVLHPDVLPDMDRMRQFTRHFHREVSELRTPLVLIGEGGLGKSVLLGQIFDAVRSTAENAAVVLVPCNQIPTSAALDTMADVDRAFGAVALDRLDAPPLSAIIDGLDPLEPVFVLVDTVDLVVREQNADIIAQALRALSRRSKLIWSCRDHEWSTYLRSVRGIGDAQYTMPILDTTDIAEWTRAYLVSEGAPVALGDRFVESLVGPQSSPGTLRVLATPLRLAMACEIYAEAGSIPDDLTVTELYDDYWEKRIARDRRGRGARSADAVRQVAMANALAAEMWSESGERFAVTVPGSSLTDRDAVDLLLSDGVVTTFEDRFGFFHQTFGEYSVARELRRAGTATDLARLRAGLADSAIPAYWPIARHLAALRMDDARYRQVREAIPLSEVEGVKARLLGAFGRGAADQVGEIAAFAEGRLLDSNALVLANAPARCHGAAADVLIDRIGRAVGKALPRVVTAAGALRARLGTETERAEVTARILRTLFGRADFGSALCASVTRDVVAAAVADGLEQATVAVLTGRYGQLPQAARRELLRAVAAAPALPARDVELLVTAAGYECPDRSVPDITALLLRTWPEPAFRIRMGWQDWAAALNTELPRRWDSCQIRLVANLCRDRAVATEILYVATGGGAPDVVSDRYVNIGKFIADEHRDLALRTVLGLGPALTTTAVGVACEIVVHTADSFTAEERIASIAVLEQWIEIVPRAVRPAMVKASGTDSVLLIERLRELRSYRAAKGDATVVGSTLDTFLNICAGTPVVLVGIAAELRLLGDGADLPSRARRARLDGLVCGYDPDTRPRIADHVRSASNNIASAAATAVDVALEHWPTETIEADAADWLFELLGSPFANTVRVIANRIHALGDRIPAERSRVDGLVGRLRRSLADGDDPQTVSAILTLLVDIDRIEVLERSTVVDILDAFRGIVLELLPEEAPGNRRRHLAALFAIYKQALTALGPAHLAVPELEDRIVDLLKTVDAGKIGERSRRPLAHLLLVVARRSADFLDRLEQVWPQASEANRAAIAEAFTTWEAGGAGHRSLALARRADCPPRVAGLIYDTFE